MTLLVSCDTVYAQRYAPAFFMSCVKAGQPLHLNIINPDDETNKMLRDMMRVSPDLFDSSVSNGVPRNVVSYTFQRFIMARMLLEAFPERRGYYTVDVDSLVLRALPWPPDYDLGLWLRPEERSEGLKVLASLCYFSVNSTSFLQKAEEEFCKLPLEWFADQVALSRAYAETRGLYRFQDLRKLGQISWEQEDYGKAAIFQGKGPRKKRPFFVKMVEGLRDEFRERVEHRAVEEASRGGVFSQSPVLRRGN